MDQYHSTPRSMAQHVATRWPNSRNMLERLLSFGQGFKFETGKSFQETFVDVASCCSRLDMFMQQCCAWAFSIPNMSQHVATGWPNSRNMLRYSCAETLRSFDWSLQNLGAIILVYLFKISDEHPRRINLGLPRERPPLILLSSRLFSLQRF